MPLVRPSGGFPTPQLLSTCQPNSALTNVAITGNQAAASGTVAANVAYFYPVRLTDTRTYQKAWWVNGAAVAGNVDVGIYTVSGTTATRVVASTAEAQATISVVQVATTFTATTLTAGLYYLAISCSNATGALWRQNPALTLLKNIHCFQAATSHPLPSTATVAALSTAWLPVFGFSELAVM